MLLLQGRTIFGAGWIGERARFCGGGLRSECGRHFGFSAGTPRGRGTPRADATAGSETEQGRDTIAGETSGTSLLGSAGVGMLILAVAVWDGSYCGAIGTGGAGRGGIARDGV